MGRPKKVKEEPKKVEPIVLEMGKAIDGKTWKGETFDLTKTTHGILYHVYGGYSIFVTPNNVALYETLDDLIEHQDAYNKFTGKEKDLAAEKKIFGKDFAYIRHIESFSKITGRYLRKLLEEDML